MDTYGRSPRRLSPSEIRRQHEAGTVGHRAVERLLTELEEDFQRRVKQIASKYNVDAGDLQQAAVERLLRQQKVDPEHERLMGWIDRCIRFAAKSLVQERLRHPEPIGDLPDAEDVWQAAEPGFTDRMVDLLSEELNEHELKIVLLLVHDPDLGMQAIADAIGKKYACTRKAKQRALDKLRDCVGLTDEELAAYLAWRKDDKSWETEALHSAKCKVARFLDGEC